MSTTGLFFITTRGCRIVRQLIGIRQRTSPLVPHGLAPLCYRQHEREADALACRLMATAGVQPLQWTDGLAVLQHAVAGEQHPVGKRMPAGGSTFRVVQRTDEAEEEEEDAYDAAAGRVAAKATALLASGRPDAAQQLLDGSLRWPLPAVWLSGLTAEQQAALLACAMRTHPPLAARTAWVQDLAVRSTSVSSQTHMAM